ncbi:MAG TPA: 30S ribosome-binding factor RbfA [Candidatus Omnitrophota bacterium]|nr:30S ribosome-binding factor RbfA [Candidatus Omnitrophota bacterium]
MARYEKVQEAIRQEASLILQDELKDPRLGFVTITRVEMTPDLRYAKIFFSVLGKDEDYQKTKDALNSAVGFIRKLISERINLKFAPEISFKEDRSGEYSVRIQEVLDEIKELEKPKNEPRTFLKKAGVKEKVRGEPKKSRRVHKKK